MRPRVRFSLRSLLIFTAVAAGCCYWLVLPSVNARRFVAAAAAGDYALADRLFADPDDRFLESWSEQYPTFKLHAELAPFSPGELLRGERHVLVSIACGYAPVHTKYLRVRVLATRAGLDSPRIEGGSTSTPWHDPPIRSPVSALCVSSASILA